MDMSLPIGAGLGLAADIGAITMADGITAVTEEDIEVVIIMAAMVADGKSTNLVAPLPCPSVTRTTVSLFC
jgi:hypothetical protein